MSKEKMTIFQRQLETQNEAMLSKDIVTKVETWYLIKDNIEFGVLYIVMRDGTFIKSAYKRRPNNEAEYIGFQVDDDNYMVCPYDTCTCKDVQDILWDVFKDGERLF